MKGDPIRGSVTLFTALILLPDVAMVTAEFRWPLIRRYQ
jgi:hypothetical protein